MIGAILGGLGAAGGAIMGMNQTHAQYLNQQKLNEQQFRYAQQLGQKNQEYALQMAKRNQEYALQSGAISHQYNKEMWDYTNYENQVAHMKAAGLNPALMYGTAGQGGQTAGGTVGSGSGSPGSNPATQATQAPASQAVAGMGMGMQLGNMIADVKLKQSQARLNEVEADKKEGVDTELIRAMTKLNEASILNTEMSTEEIAAKAKLWGDTSQKIWQEARKAAAEADITESTKDDIITKTAYETTGSLLDNMQKAANIKLTERQEKAIGEQLAIAWMNAGTGRMSATTAADQVANEMYKITGELDIKQKTLLKDWIYQGVHAGVALLEGVTDIIKVKSLIKAAAKGMKQIITTRKRGNNDKNDFDIETIKEIFKD